MDTLIRRPEVQRRTGYSKASIYRLVHAGDFPAPVRLGVRAVAWRTEDIDAWIASRRAVGYGPHGLTESR